MMTWLLQYLVAMKLHCVLAAPLYEGAVLKDLVQTSPRTVLFIRNIYLYVYGQGQSGGM